MGEKRKRREEADFGRVHVWNRGIAAPAFICCGQTVLLDICEEGSRADVLRGQCHSHSAGSSCSAAFCQMCHGPSSTSHQRKKGK